MSQTIAALPPYPSSRTRSSLSPSQQAQLNQAISGSLKKILELGPAQRDTSATRTFLSTYVKDSALQVLQGLIWTNTDAGQRSAYHRLSPVEKDIRHNAFLLCEKLASAGSLDMQTLLDLSAAYASTNPTRLRALFSSTFQHTSMKAEVPAELVPAFESLLSNHSGGLYGIRKSAHILLSFLRPSPKEVVLCFAQSKLFMLALAKGYDHDLSSISQAYGGFNISMTSASRPLDDWERIFLDTKVALLDAFHILINTLLESIASVPSAGPALAARSEPAFEVIFALLDVQPSRGGVNAEETTPFLDRSLLADYQHAYNLSRVLHDILGHVDNTRTDHLAAALRSLDVQSVQATGGSGGRAASPTSGVLKLLISSSGVPPGIDNLGNGTRLPSASSKGKSKAAPPIPEDDIELDSAISQILDVLPEQPPDYLRFLLSHPDYPYQRNAERLLDALFSGTAPSPDEVKAAMRTSSHEQGEAQRPVAEEDFVFTKERRNVFDDEAIDLNQLRVGKKNVETMTSLTDRTFTEQMKADILRRAEEISDSEDEEEDGQRVPKGREVAYEDELDDDGAVKVRDGEDTEDDDDEQEQDREDAEAKANGSKNPETILELAYLHDPKLFDRDGQTRRSKERADLKSRTGWSDEQIEGWRIMLERNPRKDKILAKHEFSGNRTSSPAPVAGPSHPRGSAERGARGRANARRGGRRGGGGRGGGQRQEGEGGGEGSTRDRAWKDRNKASRGNHNRKRGHDKKMARAGGPS